MDILVDITICVCAVAISLTVALMILVIAIVLRYSNAGSTWRSETNTFLDAIPKF